MRGPNQQTIPEELARRVAELSARVAELTQRLELSERAHGNGNGLRQQQADSTIRDLDDWGTPIEFLTDNGFTIIRPWEEKGSAPPKDGLYRFRVSDPLSHERDINVEISNQLLIETGLHTRERVELSSTFWICCAERHLANYVAEHDEFPDGNHLIVESLDREEVLLALRWGKSD